MNRLLEKWLVIGLGLMVLFVGSGTLNYWNTNRLNEDAAWVAHTQEVLDLTSDTLRTLVDAETGIRGFLITGKDEYLQPYDAARQRLAALMTTLQEQTADNPSQQERVERLLAMTAVQMGLLKESINLRRKNEKEAQAFIASDKGKAQMDAIRQLIAEMEQVEHSLLQQRQGQSRRTYVVAQTSALFSAALGLVMVGAFYWLMRRSLAERLQVNAVLHEQREWLRATLTSIGDGVIATDAGGRVTLLNTVAKTLTGWSEEEAKGERLETVFRIENEETRQRVENPAARALREGVIVGLANHSVLITKDGRERPIDDSASPINGEKGQVIGCVLVFRDITARRRLEKEIAGRHAAARFLAAIVESSADAILSKSLDGTILSWNASAQRLFGFTSEQAVGRNITFLIPADRAEEERQIISRICAGETIDHFETVRLRSDGQGTPVSLTISPIRDEAGEIIGVSKIVRDITELKQAEEAEERMRSVVNHVVDGIITIDERGTVATFNPAAEKIFGYQASEVIGQNVKLLMPEPFHSAHDGYLANYLQTGKAKIIGIGREVVGRRKHGSTFPLDLAVSMFHLGQRRHFTGIVRDISERKRAEAALKESAEDLARSNLDLEQFAYVASHDLQEPLRAVSGCVQVLQRRYQGKLDERADELIAHTVDGVNRMQGLINDLLAYSRLGTQGKAFQAADGNAILEQALANLEVAIAEADAIVTHDQLPRLRVDAAQLAQVFQNLVNNALKFRKPERPEIHVGVQRQGDHWLFRVQDNGIGIQPEYFERIFVLFQRLHTRTEYPGTGIGLAICRKIVERHGGRIGVESEPGEGSTFFFTIPER